MIRLAAWARPAPYNSRRPAPTGADVMPRFRPHFPAPGLDGVPLSLETVRLLLTDVTAPRHFFTGPALRLAFRHLPAEESAWEVFQGRLIDPAHTRQKATFEAWNVHHVQQDGLSA